MCMGAYKHVCAYMWRPEVDVKSHPQFLFHWLIKAVSFNQTQSLLIWLVFLGSFSQPWCMQMYLICTATHEIVALIPPTDLCPCLHTTSVLSSLFRSWLRSTGTMTSRLRWQACGGTSRTPMRGTSSPTPVQPTARSSWPTQTSPGASADPELSHLARFCCKGILFLPTAFYWLISPLTLRKHLKAKNEATSCRHPWTQLQPATF